MQKKIMSTFAEIRKKLDDIKIIDSRERINTDLNYELEKRDALCTYTMHFLLRDLASAGVVGENLVNSISDSKVPAITRTKLISPYLKACFNTGHMRSLSKALSDLHGVNELNIESLDKIQCDFDKCKNTDYIFDILRNKCNIESALIDVGIGNEAIEVDKRIFKKVWHPEKYIKPGPISGEVIKWVERHYAPITCLDDWVSAFDEDLTNAIGRGATVIKVSLGSIRSLSFADVPYEKAKASFDKMLLRWQEVGAGQRDHVEFSKTIQNFMMHRVLSSLRGRDAVIQFETGIQNDNSNIISHANPKHLNKLFKHYPDVKFDVVGGWPYSEQFIAMAKMFPNVYINFAGYHVNSPASCVASLINAMDTVPLNKIIGFGGDYMFVDGVYGQLEVAKDNIARALATLIDYKVFTEDMAIKVAEAILYKNPKKLYKL